MHRDTTHARRLITTAGILASAAGSALAITPNLDFGVDDQASYEVFCDAIRASEYVRYDYVNDPNPRVVGAATALVAFASRNPLADGAQLTGFIDTYDAMLAGHAPGDPDLDRSSNLLTALRFTTPDSSGVLAGTDTDVGGDVIGLLAIDVPEPDNYDSMKRRMVRFDRARIRSFSNAAAWTQMLVIGFSGHDLNGVPNAHLAGVLKAYLESQGFEPEPDGSPDDSRFNLVNSGLAGSLPASYADYANLLAQPIETSPLWTSIRGAFNDVADQTQGRIIDFQSAMMNEPTLIEGIANANDQSFMDQLEQQYRDRLDSVAGPRTIVSANALFMLQSADPSVRNLAQQSLDFSEVQLETNETMAGISAGVEYVGGLAQLGFGIAAGSPGDAIEGLTNSVLGGIGLVGAFGDSPPSTEEQIFDEVTEMRDQLEDVRVEMNMRFDRIEDQLDVIYDSMATGFNALGNQIGDLSADVEDLSREMMIARAALERIEDALWGMSSDILDSFIAADANQYLDYRDDNGTDLPYNGSTSFIDALNGFFTVATFHARDTETFAGPQASILTVENAGDLLNGESIGRNINDLRVFPAQIGLPVLWNDRVAAPAPWSQAASAYAQIARENPWYFAYKYERELASGGTPPELDVIIDLGEDLTAASANGRNTALFDALFAGYHQAAGLVGDYVDIVRNDVLTGESVPFMDPWGGAIQDVRPNAATFTMLDGQNGLDDLPLPNGIGANCWNVYGFSSRYAALISVIVKPIAASLGGSAPESHKMIMTDGLDGVSNDFTIEFRYSINGNVGGQRPDLNITRSRTMRFEYYSFDTPVNINSDGQAIDLFDEDFFFWTQVRGALLTGENLQGQAIHVTNGNGEEIRLDVVSDSPFSAVTAITNRLEELQDAVWTAAAADSDIQDIEPVLFGYESLIEAYATLALPDMLEQSTVARACLRANPDAGELSMSFAESISDKLLSFVGDGDGDEYFDFAGELALRAGIAHDEVDAALARPAAGQSFVDWTLAELNHLRDRVFRLAIGDTYAATGGVTLSVDAPSGVLANDVDQQFRDIRVDTAFTGGPGSILPQNGSVQIHEDGSFTYTPDPGFTGSDSFSYRTFTDDPSWIAPVYSDPATVVILVGAGNPCPVDFDGNGILDLADITAFITGFTANDPLADLAEPFGQFDLADIVAFVAAFNAGCP
jgi:hypothetical protein